jgi:thymidylate synthase ThyX
MEGTKMVDMYNTPEVTLLTWTRDPLETVFSIWEASKTEDALRLPEEIADEVHQEDVEELFRAIIAQRIPVGEHIDFVFMLENVSVSYREQMVRHRIGTLPSPERVGVDVVMDSIPDLADSTWWSQSMRIQDMGHFANRKQYRMPQSVLDHGDSRMETLFNETMGTIERAYKTMVEAGIPMEDARELIPLGAQHRISWKLNMGALQHIVGKRSCWILQLGIWGPVIQGMVDELVTKVNPIFREIVTPPCMQGNKFTGCVYMEECRRRLTEDDQLPPCPLHLNYHGLPENQRGMAPLVLAKVEIPRKAEMLDRAEDYTRYWGRDPFSGELLER